MSLTDAGLYSRMEHASDVYSPEQLAHMRSTGLWRDTLLVDLLDEHARSRGDQIAVVDESTRCTWAELRDRVDRLAASFVGLGLRPRDFVGVQLPNVIEFVVAYLACQRAGLRPLIMMTIYRDKDVAYMLDKCRARAYVAPSQHRGYDFVAMAGRVRGRVPTLDHVVIVGEPDPGMLSYDALVSAPAPAEGAFTERRPDPDELSKICFTSGTTGLAKGVAHTHNTDLVPALLVAKALGLGPHTPIWMPSPIAHTTGLLFGVYDSLLCGAKLVLQDAWDPAKALELVSREKAAFTVSATPFIAGMLDQDLSGLDLSNFRYFVSGGARIPPSLVERARDDMGCLLLRVFGMSEAPLHTLNLPDDPWDKVTGRDGKPLPGVDVRISDPADRAHDVPVGELGEYATRGPHVFLGYYEDPQRTLETRDPEGWYYSGDLCQVDDEGYVLYVDRTKDIINRGGIKISALEVENLLAEHPAVRTAAVVAIPDDRLGERACAFVVPREGQQLTLHDLSAFLESRGVTKQKWPEQLHLISQFPVTATGKVQKNVLRDRVLRATPGQ